MRRVEKEHNNLIFVAKACSLHCFTTEIKITSAKTIFVLCE